jgi:hypothetical protein
VLAWELALLIALRKVLDWKRARYRGEAAGTESARFMLEMLDLK